MMHQDQDLVNQKGPQTSAVLAEVDSVLLVERGQESPGDQVHSPKCLLVVIDPQVPILDTLLSCSYQV